uniref:isoleucine--tRNA ligase n=1 Tax=Kwoniella pini CBS 10737 TaxID=1296096 RepID=A0A1B9I898_9TREE|nr:isoleucine-tRNA ligase [Kwoniella pini CBS 10737]OCF51757.1 isoleucine-tRNA ligase [Kwoniella pini CBS 10737]
MTWLARVPVVPLRLIPYHLAASTSCIHQVRHASTASSTAIDKKKAYSHTLLLPKTDFPLKHKDIVAAEKRYRYKTSDQLYKEQITRENNPLFVLHDGPPYANGNLHMGHALNKVLKDIINRYNLIRGKRVHYVPGWDCHGLPIEHKALAAIGKSHMSMQPTQVREEARRVALEAINIQKNEIKDLGVMADWEGEKGTYRTLDHDFEIRQLNLFKTMVERGFITHRLRPTYYSPSSRTALAEAELSYKDGHKSRSVYVAFPVEEADMSESLREVYQRNCGVEEKLELAIWTTTPWTLPANMGVAVHNDMEYAIVRMEGGRNLVIGVDRLEPMQEVLGNLEVIGRLPGSQLVGTRYTSLFHSPTLSQSKPSIMAAKHVTAQAGTGLVHSAPAHGHEDYEAFMVAGMLPDELRCPVDDDGRFTSDLMKWTDGDVASSLVGKEVLGDGPSAVIELLKHRDVLLAEQKMEHRYPYDWKSKKPIIVRATPQWFADVEAIKGSAVEALEGVHFHPAISQKRLESFITSRSEWCISRQRSWGVPIPALFGSEGPIMDQKTLEHVISVLNREGVDYWWKGQIEDFIPPHLQGQTLTRSNDTLDVWFDSGSSWTMLEHLRRDPLADVYLEGSDQHRGWFQSSILTKLISSSGGSPPYGTVITHGFVMDEKGDKMSKSAGNGLSPMDIIHGKKDFTPRGADILRLWVASVDYTNDASIGPTSISNATENMRKLRNTLRFLLANTTNAESQELGDVTLRPVDRYILHELSSLENLAQGAYDSHTFNKVLNSATTFASTTLSAFYFDVIKDTMYCSAVNDPTRQAIIAVLHHTLHRLTRILAPITPHLAEELYEYMKGKESSVFLDPWSPNLSWLNPNLKAEFSQILSVRAEVQKLAEQARSEKHIKTSNQAHVNLSHFMGSDVTTSAQSLSALLGVSSVSLQEPAESQAEEWQYESSLELETLIITVQLVPAKNSQCPRCWLYTAEVAESLCERPANGNHAGMLTSIVGANIRMTNPTKRGSAMKFKAIIEEQTH